MAPPIFAAAAAKIGAAATKVGQQVGLSATKKAAGSAANAASNAVKGNAGQEAENSSSALKAAARSTSPAEAGINVGVHVADKAVKQGMPGGWWGVILLPIFLFFMAIMVFVTSVMGMMSTLFGGAVGADAATKSVQFCGNTSAVASSPVEGLHPMVLDAINKAAARYNIDWTLLAGVVTVESRAYLKGETLGADGTFNPPIIGVQLNGDGDVAEIRDTDNGRLDGDTEYDRAVGPAQFIPSTWQGYKADGNGDGISNPQNIYDAVFAMAEKLIDGGIRKNPDRAFAIYNGGTAAANNQTSKAWTVYRKDVKKEVQKYRDMNISVAPGADMEGEPIGAEGDISGMVFPVLGAPKEILGYGVKGSFEKGYHPGIDFGLPETQYDIEYVEDGIDLITKLPKYKEVKTPKPQVPIVAVTEGTVIFTGDAGADYGKTVQIKHPDGKVSLYGHLSEINVNNGQRVVTGQQIGRGGQTFEKFGARVHFELRTTPYAVGDDINPAKWLKPAQPIDAPADPSTGGVINTMYEAGAGGSIFIVGDSLTVGVVNSSKGPAILSDGFGAAQWDVEADVGWPTSKGIEILKTDKRAKKAGTWIVALGTNDGLGANSSSYTAQNYRKYIDEVMRLAGDERAVIWVNVYRPQYWPDPSYDPVNRALKESESVWANLKVKNWASSALDNPKWIEADKIHYKPAGYEARAKTYVTDITGITANVDCETTSEAVGGTARGDGATKALAYAMSKIGTPWAANAIGPDAYSSPGLVWRAFSEQGLTWKPMTPSTMQKSKYLVEIKKDEQPGDLVFLTVRRDSDFAPSNRVGSVVVGIVSEPGSGKAIASTPTGATADGGSYGGVREITYKDAKGNLIPEVNGLYVVVDPNPDSTYLGNATGGCQECVDLALKQVGKRYVTTANPPSTFNCSVLTGWVWETVTKGKVDLVWYSDSQYSATDRIPTEAAQPGDLVFYQTHPDKTTGHVGMYIGNGKMVHAANPSDGVRIDDIQGPWYKERFMGVHRVRGWY